MHDQLEIQASQFIINIFENSKSQSEDALDSLPGIYAIIDIQGKILKGNRMLAKIFNVNFEQLLGLNICDLFSEISKPIFLSNITNPNEFEADITTKDNKNRTYLWNTISLNVNHRNLPPLYSVMGHDVTDLNSATKENSRMQFELKTAKIVQETFLPPSSATFGTSSISGYSETASECGGDWWHYNLVNNKLYMWIGDVTGHGVNSALVVSAVHSVVSIMDEMSPSKCLALLNRAINSTGNNPSVMTFLVACVDLNTKQLTYASAAHEPIIILPHNKLAFKIADLQLLESNPSSPLGMAKTSIYEEHTIQLSAGDRLLFHTDGVYDIVDPTGKRWNKSVFYRTLAMHASKSKAAGDLITALQLSVNYYRKGATLIDDTTFFMFQM